jgi:hypothetical protein
VLHVEDNLSNITLIERVLAQRPGIEASPRCRAGSVSSWHANTNPV